MSPGVQGNPPGNLFFCVSPWSGVSRSALGWAVGAFPRADIRLHVCPSGNPRIADKPGFKALGNHELPEVFRIVAVLQAGIGQGNQFRGIDHPCHIVSCRLNRGVRQAGSESKSSTVELFVMAGQIRKSKNGKNLRDNRA